MKITIDSVRTMTTGETEVIFSCDAGRGIAFWHGAEPTSGQLIDVEMNIEEELCWGKSIREVEFSKDEQLSVEDDILIVAFIDSLDEDGVVSIRICDSIVLLETMGTPHSSPTMVEIRCHRLDLFPTGV
jgi:hypothetical protein